MFYRVLQYARTMMSFAVIFPNACLQLMTTCLRDTIGFWELRNSYLLVNMASTCWALIKLDNRLQYTAPIPMLFLFWYFELPQILSYRKYQGHVRLSFTWMPTFLISSSVWISGDSPPCTHRNCWFISAARGRASNDSMHTSYTLSEYLILPEIELTIDFELLSSCYFAVDINICVLISHIFHEQI